MRERVLGRYAWAGALREDVVRLDAALTAALRRREALLADEHQPRFLHPARTVLILMDDTAVHEARVLAAALLTDSLDARFALALPADPEASALAAAIPTPASERELLLETLLAAPTEVRLVACAERLDHARHAHMVAGEDVAAWIAEARAVYLPVAARTNPLLARRFEHWAGARDRRLRGH